MALCMMEEYLATNAYDAAYDIADLLHVLPDIVIRGNEKQLKRYWKVYVYQIYQFIASICCLILWEGI